MKTWHLTWENIEIISFQNLSIKISKEHIKKKESKAFFCTICVAKKPKQLYCCKQLSQSEYTI